MTEERAALIRHQAAPALARALDELDERLEREALARNAAAPTTPTRRATHTPDKRPAPAASPAAEEVAS